MKNFKSLAFAILGGALAFGLTACGDDVTEQVTEQIYSTVESVGSVDSKKDLPECTKDLAGQTAFVKNPGEFFGCDGESWRQLGNNSVSFGDNFCYSEELKDEEGFEIFCNKVSLGKVFNGEDGKDGKDGKDGSAGSNGAPGSAGSKGEPGDKGKPGDGCKMIDKQADSLKVVIQCGTETFAMNLSGLVTLSECKEGDTDCADPQGDVQLSGQSQKGPYVSGTDVSAYELLDGKTLKQTGNMFAGKIEREDGLFNIKTVKLSSQYAYLVADGFYRNEVTGKVSSTTLKLRALANLKRKNTANINLITHLEYDRASNLVTGKTAMKVMDAKKQAEEEILKAFYIDPSIVKSSEYAEDFNILSDKGSGNGALLAISVMLQGDRTEAQLTAALASISVDLGMDGRWDNEELKAEIADWTMQKEMSKNGFASINKNIEGWNIDGTIVPAFESYAHNFWMTELGFEECSDKNVGTIAAVHNKNSSFYAAKDSAHTEGDNSLTRFICVANGDAYAWREATDKEKDVAALKSAEEGTFAAGKINTNFIYVFEDGAWRRGTELDVKLRVSCIKDRMGITDSTITKKDTTWYICDETDDATNNTEVPYSWRKATEAEADTAGFDVPKSASEMVRMGNVNKSHFYVYEDGWRYGTSLDYDSQLNPCTVDKLNNVALSSKGVWHKCSNDRSSFVEGFEVPVEWREMTDAEIDTLGFGKISATYKQGSKTKKWYKNGLALSDELADFVKVLNSISVVVGNSTINVTYGSDYDRFYSNDGLTIVGSVTGKYYTFDYDRDDWFNITKAQYELGIGGCTKKLADSSLVLNGTSFYKGSSYSSYEYPKGTIKRKNSSSDWYFCKHTENGYEWVNASPERVDKYGSYCYTKESSKYRSAYNGTGANANVKTYVCDADTFRTMTPSEKWAARSDVQTNVNKIRCGKDDEGADVTITGVKTKFICKNRLYVWDGNPATVGSVGTISGYSDWNNSGVNSGVAIGTRLWTKNNLFKVGSNTSMVICEKNWTPGEFDHVKMGSFFPITGSAASTACESISGRYNFRLPSEQEYKDLFDVFASNPNTMLKSRDGWNIEGGNSLGFDMYPSGMVTYDTNKDHNLYRLEFGYTVACAETKDQSNYRLESSSLMNAKKATFVTSDKTAFVFQENISSYDVYSASSTGLYYASVRCVYGDVPSPPLSND